MLSAEASSAICVQRFDDSRNSAIHTTYRISLRSSSLREPRYPLLRVVSVRIAGVSPCEAASGQRVGWVRGDQYDRAPLPPGEGGSDVRAGGSCKRRTRPPPPREG